MRIKIIFAVLFFLLMAAVPIGLMVKTPTKEADKPKETNEADIISAANLCDRSFCDEAIRAVSIIQKTNSRLGKSNDKPDNISDKELYRRVKEIYNSNSEILFDNNKPVAIPVSACSNGFTVQDKQYPYLDAVASPWDCFNEKYSDSAECAGVSINGIKYLCEKGCSAEEALKWYLPKLTVA